MAELKSKTAGIPYLQKAAIGFLSLAVAAAVWFPLAHLLFIQDISSYFNDTTVSPVAKKLIARQVYLWNDPAGKKEIQAVRKSNPEWDFMWRTFTVVSLANTILKDRTFEKELLPVMDGMIDDTLAHLDKDGMQYFLMEYAKYSPYNIDPARSMFIDGEVSLMLSARRLIKNDKKYNNIQQRYFKTMIERCRLNYEGVLSMESYPDEYWVFDHCNALVSMKIADQIDGTDHSAFINEWLKTAKKRLVDKRTGMLISGYDRNGTVLHGPEGSTIWMTVEMLRFLDKDYAKDQYGRAKKELSYKFLGFSLAREWPKKSNSYVDIDSGGMLSALGAGSASSGFAIVAARSFEDRKLQKGLLCSLKFGGLPTEKNGMLKYSSSNLVGDAVILYAVTSGPIYARVCKGGAK